MFGPLLVRIKAAAASFAPAQTNRTVGENKLWCDLTERNEAGVRAPRVNGTGDVNYKMAPPPQKK